MLPQLLLRVQVLNRYVYRVLLRGPGPAQLVSWPRTSEKYAVHVAVKHLYTQEQLGQHVRQ